MSRTSNSLILAWASGRPTVHTDPHMLDPIH